MNINLDDFDPNSLLTFDQLHQSLIDPNAESFDSHIADLDSILSSESNYTTRITSGLFRQATSAIISVASTSTAGIASTQQVNQSIKKTIRRPKRKNSNLTNNKSFTSTLTPIQTQPDNDQNMLLINSERTETSPNQCIDLTKENDDVLVITSNSPRVSKATTARRSTRKNSSRLASAKVKTTSRPRLRNTVYNALLRNDPNATIVLDDERNDSILVANQNQAENCDIIPSCSPSKRSKLSSNDEIPTKSNNSDTSSNSSLPKCPVCLDNLDELKQRNKKLMATFCGHVLCNLCLDEHFKQSGGSSGAKTILCPTCRTKLTKAKIHTLYL